MLGPARHVALRLLVASLLTVGTVASGCSDQRELRDDAATTSRPIDVAAPTTEPTTEIGRVIARLAGVDTGELRLGGEFNARFLAVQFRAVGLEPGEVDCAVAAVVAGATDDFAARAVGSIMSVQMVTPTVLTGCVSTDRLMDLASGGVRPDLSRVPADQLRSVFTSLATGGYLAGGFTEDEAACLATAAVGAASDQELAELTTAVDLSGFGVADALDGCVTPERIAELAG